METEYHYPFPLPSNQKSFLNSTVNIYIPAPILRCPTIQFNSVWKLSLMLNPTSQRAGFPTKLPLLEMPATSVFPKLPALLSDLFTNSEVCTTRKIG